MRRRTFLLTGASLPAAAALPMLPLAQSAAARHSRHGLLRTTLRVRYAWNRIADLPVFTRTLTNAGEHEHMLLELRANVGNAPPTFHQLAFDGISLPKLGEAQCLFQALGNRLDVLVKIDKPGVYRLIKPELCQGTPAAEFDNNGCQ